MSRAKMRLMVLAAALAAATGAHAGPQKAAVFDFQFSKGTPMEPSQEERERLVRLSDQLRSLLKDSGRYELVSTEPVRDDVAKGSDLRSCNGCAEDYAKTLGADAAITGEVQKSRT